MLIDIGSGCTDVIVLKNGSVIDLATFAFGAKDVTENISASLKVSRKEAAELLEKKSIALESSTPEKTHLTGENPLSTTVDRETKATEHPPGADKIITYQLLHFFENLIPVIESCKGQSGLPAGIVLTGGMSQLPGIEKFASQIFELPVRIGNIKGLNNLSLFDQPTYYTSALGMNIYETKKLTRIDRMGKIEKCRHNIANWIDKVA